MTKHYDVCIAGGGMVGMTLAIALAHEDLSVALVEKESLPSQLDPAFDGRVSAIALGSQRILENIGVWEAIAPHAEPILDIRVTDGLPARSRSGFASAEAGHTPVFLHYDHREVGSEPFGTIAENRHIRHALQLAARQQKNITLIENTSLENFTSDEKQITVHLSGHSPLTASLLIGAEGRQSKVRALAGIDVTTWSYGQTAIVCTIAHEKPHDGLAQERFLPAGPFAVLPMRGNHSSLVWVEPSDRVPLYLALSDDELAQEISERVGDYLGKITVAGKRFSYPLSLMHAKDYIAPRVALAGDAAHGMHPIAGQGVNIGFRDVAVLAELLGDAHRKGCDIASQDILEHYQRWRRFDNVAMLAATDGLNRLFSTNIIPIKLARDFGLWAVGKMPPVKRFFMKNAMGLTGDVPKLMKKG